MARSRFYIRKKTKDEIEEEAFLDSVIQSGDLAAGANKLAAKRAANESARDKSSRDSANRDMIKRIMKKYNVLKALDKNTPAPKITYNADGYIVGPSEYTTSYQDNSDDDESVFFVFLYIAIFFLIFSLIFALS